MELARSEALPLGSGVQSNESRESGAAACPGFMEAHRPHRGDGWLWTRTRRVQVCISVLLVVVLLLQGIQALESRAPTPQAGSSAVQARTLASKGSTANAVASAIGAAPAPSGVQLASLCLLGAAPGCGPGASPVALVPAPTAVDPPSSWVNLTNPSLSAPSARVHPAMVFSPADHGDLLFGGFGPETVPPYTWVFHQDTWLLQGTTWSELVDPAACTPSTCPSPRAGAMIASLGASGVLLFGGYNETPNFGGFVIHPYADTWLFSGGAWHNVTASAGTPPSARFDGSMAYDSLDNLEVLFGGETALGATLGDTWEYASGAWSNVTSTAGSVTLGTAPEPRAGAAMATSPDGHVMMFGGEDQGNVIENSCHNGSYDGPGLSSIAWWFYQGAWSKEAGYGFIPLNGCLPLATTASNAIPTVTSDPPTIGPPCGREFPALGWSKNNARFVVYGGYGPLPSVGSSFTMCGGSSVTWNDTWSYAEPSGGGFDWLNVTDAGDPVAREGMGYAGDLSNGYFVIFGGYQGATAFNETWRFFELVHAKLTGPATIDTSGNPSFLLPFIVTGSGGSSVLTFSFTLTKLKTPNDLSPVGDCSILTSGGTYALPFDGVDSFFCQPTSQSYNIFRATVQIVDVNNVTDTASASWTFTVLPPEAIHIYSQYKTYFYVGFDFTNTFTVYAEVANNPAISLSATLGGLPLGFVQRTSNNLYWDAANTEMAHVSPGSSLAVTADFSDWTLNTTMPIHMIDTPDWLQTIYAFPLGEKDTTTKGAGPYNQTWSTTDKYSWDIGKTFNFSIPVPLVSGNYSLVPSISITFGWDSTGNVSLTGTFTLAPPKISLGVFDLKLSASLSLKGTFALELQGGDINGIKWLGADAKITITGDFSGSIPIYGFSFDFLGVNVSIGFTLELDVKPSVALDLLLAPTTDTSQELIAGIGVMVKQLIGSFKLPLQAAVQFSIGIASVQFGGDLGLALAFNVTPSFAVTGGTITGDIFVGASFLFWSTTWDLVGPGTIYSWGTGAKAMPLSTLGYDNGSNAVWVLRPRYYSGPGYDAKVWNASSAQGPAISDIYPNAEPVAAAGSNGAYVFFTNDNVSVPVNQGLGMSGAWLDADTNQLRSLPAPPDSGYVIARPQATALPDGNLFVVWNALPASELSAAGPQALTTVALHGATFNPANRTWGPVVRYQVPGVAQSFAVDPTGGGRVVALFSDGVALGEATTEHLIQFNATGGDEITYTNVTGQSAVVSSRGASGWAVLRDLGGNYSVVHLSDGSRIPISYTPPAGSALISAKAVTGSASQLVLLYRGLDASQVVLVDLSSGATLGTLPLGGNTSDVQAFASGLTSYVFAATPQGIQGWTLAGGSWANLTTVMKSGISSFGLVQDGSSLLLYAMTQTGGNRSAPIESLFFAEVAVALPRVPSTVSPTPTQAASNSDVYLLVLVAIAIADAVALAVVVLWRRRGRSPPAPEATSEPSSPPEPPTSPPQGPSGGGDAG